MKNKIITRRDFLRLTALTPLAAAFPWGRGYQPKEARSQKARVVLIRDKEALLGFKRPNPKVIQRMLDEAVTALLEESNVLKAWQKLVKPSDIVGIKTNVWHFLPTGAEIEQAIKRRVMKVGVPEENIGIDDRGVLRNPIFKKTTVLINARPARTHYWAGMGSCIKNYIQFVPVPSAYHHDSCADLAKIWSLPLVKGKTRLNILVMLTPLFHGVGPHHYNNKYIWEYKGLLVGQDPVAVDSTGLRILQAKRQQFFGRERSLQTPAKHIFLADTRHHLGVSNPDQIELIKLGWKEEILI